jgi:hypothetical protein
MIHSMEFLIQINGIYAYSHVQKLNSIMHTFIHQLQILQQPERNITQT